VSVRGGGMIIMRSASDSLLVGGTLTMGGGDETGKLTAGVITVGGDFNQPPASSASAFVSTGTHRIVMLGTRAQQMTFTYGLGISSHFNDLEIQGTSSLFLAGRMPVTGNVAVLGARAITGNDSLIVSGNVTTAAGSSLGLPDLTSAAFWRPEGRTRVGAPISRAAGRPSRCFPTPPSRCRRARPRRPDRSPHRAASSSSISGP